MRPLVIEFTGLPGAGKTTAASEIIARMRSMGYDCAGHADLDVDRRRFVRWIKLGLFSLKHPGVLFPVIRYAAAVHPFRPAPFRRSLELLKWSYRLRVAQKNPHAVVLLHEGILHDAWCVLLEGELRSEKALKKALTSVLSSIKQPLAFVSLEVDKEIALERIGNRTSTSLFSSGNFERARTLLNLHGTRYEEILNHALAVTHAPFCRVNGDSSLEEICSEVIGFISGLGCKGGLVRKDQTAMRSDRIALFLPSLEGGGAQRVMLNLARGFAERGFATDMVLAKAEGPYLSTLPENVRLVNLDAGRMLFSLPALVKYLRQARPSVMLSALNHANVIAMLARKVSGVSTRVAISIHNTISVQKENAANAKVKVIPYLLRVFSGWCDAIIAVSHGVAEDFAGTVKIPLDRIDIIYNPVITPEVLDNAKESAGHPWLTSSRTPVVLGAGRLAPQKDFRTLIRAFAQVRSRRPVRLIILGEGDERPHLEALVRELHLEEDVDLPSFVPNPFAFMARCAVFVLSSAWEGLPTVLIESLAVGTPVVSTDCRNGPREILQRGSLGRLVPVGDQGALADAINAALDEPKKVVPGNVLQPYTLDAAVENYLRVLRVSHA